MSPYSLVHVYLHIIVDDSWKAETRAGKKAQFGGVLAA